jgi:L-Ala-D/L-Glu epimerase
MRLEAEKFAIRLRRPFRIAHGSSDIRETILVHLHDDRAGLIAHGEGALPPYYPSTSEACLAWLEEVARLADAVEWETACEAQGPNEASAGRAALEIALQDLKAQRAGKPLWRLWGLDTARIPPCWRTLPIPQNEKEMQEMLEEGISSGSEHIKLKTGSGDLDWDENCMRFASARPVLVGLDANEGWTTEDAGKILSRPVCQDIAFVEQPVPRELACWDELRSRVHGMKIPPLVADESLQTEDDIVALEGRADGVNIKLLKAGGLRDARRWITVARSLGMGVMVGTMVETGIGRTAAAQLAPLADWLDIDSPDSIPASPFAGFRISGDHLVLADRPGLGLQQS